MADINPYQRQWQDYKNKGRPLYSLTSQFGLKKDDLIPIYVTTDGKIIAKGFVDDNDAFELRLDKNNQLNYTIQGGTTHEMVCTIKNDLSYSVSGVMSEQIAEGFKHYLKPLLLHDNQETLKFQNFNKTTRGLLKQAASQMPLIFDFEHENGGRYALPRMEGSWFTPFNYDVYIAPAALIKNTNDIIVIKSGEYKDEASQPSLDMIDIVSYTTGESGNIYIDTLSLPTDYHVSNADFGVKTAKIPRSGNLLNRVPDTNETLPIGPIGIFKDGILAYSYRTDEYYSSAYNNNSYIANSNRDDCEGYNHNRNVGESGIYPDNTYHRKSAPICLYDTGDSTNHSPLLGYAFDGYPIYGPYGYSTALDANSAVKLITPSWRLKPLTNRPNGPSYTTHESGFFVEDYEYVGALGDLDRHNGRECVTPEFPGGTYAYFATMATGVDSKQTGKFPYIIGDKFYGKVEKQNWEGISVTETPFHFATGYYNKFADNPPSQPSLDVDLYAEYIYGLTYRKQIGLKKETIIYVSPHETLSHSGVFLNTGEHQLVNQAGAAATYSGNLFVATGNAFVAANKQTNKYMPEDLSYSYPTSKNNLFEPLPFSGGMDYVRVDPDTQTHQNLVGHSNTTDTTFYTIYSGYKSNFKDRVWDGVWDGRITAGTPFKIEVWSFNGYINGFENRLKIYPCEPHPAVSGKVLSVSGAFEGYGFDLADAYDDMAAKGRKQLFKEIDSFLLNEAIINQNRKISRYSLLLRKGGAVI